MNGLPRDQIETVKTLKDLIISQLQALYGPGNMFADRFDVVQLRSSSLYVARAICYPKTSDRSNNYAAWTMLCDGISQAGVVDALEDLWNNVQDVRSIDFIDMSLGDRVGWDQRVINIERH